MKTQVLITLLCLFGCDLMAQSDIVPKLDLFLCIGQSNMAGRGELLSEDMTPIDNVVFVQFYQYLGTGRQSDEQIFKYTQGACHAKNGTGLFICQRNGIPKQQTNRPYRKCKRRQ